ncbi:hypothetical protein C0993_000809 [Termitomyces sp. T159_Od127]|nr:hypothetical protein C0993_000809 [Termitomyces sp. T159_Od127]
MPRTRGGRKRGAAHQQSHASTFPANSSVSSLPSRIDALNEFFDDRNGFVHDPSNPVWKEFDRLAHHLHWNKKKKKVQRENFKDVLAKTFNYMYGTDVNSLKSWTALCHVLQITPVPEELHACREAVKAVYVNLVDLVDHRQTGEPVMLFDTEAELSAYTCENKKFFPKESAYAGGLLKYLLRHILIPRKRRIRH